MADREGSHPPGSILHVLQTWKRRCSQNGDESVRQPVTTLKAWKASMKLGMAKPSRSAGGLCRFQGSSFVYMVRTKVVVLS